MTPKEDRRQARRYWQEGNRRYCEQTLDAKRIADFYTWPDSHFTEGELKRKMDVRMDNTVRFHQEHQ